jgi:hypothetical protein
MSQGGSYPKSPQALLHLAAGRGSPGKQTCRGWRLLSSITLRTQPVAFRDSFENRLQAALMEASQARAALQDGIAFAAVAGVAHLQGIWQAGGT